MLLCQSCWSQLATCAPLIKLVLISVHTPAMHSCSQHLLHEVDLRIHRHTQTQASAALSRELVITHNVPLACYVSVHRLNAECCP